MTRQIRSPEVAASRIVRLASGLASHPKQGRALLRVAAELYEAAGETSKAAAVREAVVNLKELTKEPRHRPGLAKREGES